MNIHRETEIKLYLPELEALSTKLRARGASIHMPRTLETNLVFDHPLLKLAEQRSLLRLRSDSCVSLTFKSDAIVHEDIVNRFEAEVGLTDFDTARLILEKLGFNIHSRYEKYRTTYRLEDADITLDEMPFGNFVEIEAEHCIILSVIVKFDLTEAPRLPFSYLQLFHRAKSWLQVSAGIEVADCSFANFAGLQIPLSALLVDS